eukprot:CAMPEP_0198667646 /NCGR_PEP_ID=MMETSP1467-20131203/69435_1 /TAXON_ID=1462469 /ORGANISM="unid. sp., Strain CCMP2135" /LENGTH=59 /DNA_ID=CAMNT_0044404351 /DNA_START=28 /DNA_END=203 /DNA_ORIENTATION=-
MPTPRESTMSLKLWKSSNGAVLTESSSSVPPIEAPSHRPRRDMYAKCRGSEAPVAEQYT